MMSYLLPRFGLALPACLLQVWLSVGYGSPDGSNPVSQPVRSTLSPEQIRQHAVGLIRGNLGALLEDPEVYLQTARKECKYFPEGAVYPYVMPACAYVNLALAGVIPKKEAIPKVRALLMMGIQEVAGTVHAPGGDLLKIRPDNTSGSFLGILNMGLSAYGLISDDNHFKAINDHLCETFLAWFEAKGGASLQSWPNVVWHMDTTFALASLDLWKTPGQKARVKAAYASHLKWRKRHVTLANGLPVANDRRRETRGCDLAPQIACLANMDPAYSKQLYTAFCQRHWVDYGFLYGFTEWEKGLSAGAFGDIDSGPVFMEIGGTASGFGIAIAKAMGDQHRYNRLLYELNWVSSFIRAAPSSEFGRNMLSWISRNVPGGLDPKYYSGFLYGDAFLFYTLTWTPWREGNLRGK